ncbi:MAG: hypothetical protein AAGM22_08930, partial [Acidobacteriota bacterium]
EIKGPEKPKIGKPELKKPELKKPEFKKPEIKAPKVKVPEWLKPKNLKIPTGFSAIEDLVGADGEKPPGYAVAALVQLDVLLLLTLLLFNLPLLISARLIAKLQGCVSCLAGLVTALLALITILKALVSLILMVTLLMAIPFGTLAYFAIYADFDTTKGAALVAIVMFLKIVLVICLVVANERFLLNLGLIALVGTSFLAMLIVTFLHSFPPTFLVSITDSVAAILISILAIIWAIVFLVSGVIGIISTIKGTLL